MMNRRALMQAGGLTLSALVFPKALLGESLSLGRWRQLADLPYPVQEIYPTLVRNNIHVAGGFMAGTAGVTPTDRHVQYDIASNTWRTRAALPEIRHHIGLVACGNAIYGLGGFKPGPAGVWMMQSQTWRYDIDHDTWQEQPSAPEAHGESVALVLGDIIHVIGGRSPKSGSRNAAWYDHVDSVRHLLYDTGLKQWQQAAPALNARNSAAGANINGLLYVVGGRTVTGKSLSLLEIYDAKEDRWRLGAPLPKAQGALAATAFNNRLYAFGGEYFGVDGHGVHAESWCYQPDKDQWMALTPMRLPRHGLGAVSDNRAIFVVGGATGVATQGTSAALDALYFS